MEYPALSDRIVVDEVGVATARFGDLLLKTSFVPIYAREGASFRPVAVEATTAAFRNGGQVDSTVELADAGVPLSIAAMESTLHLRNRYNLGASTIERVLSFRESKTVLASHILYGAEAGPAAAGSAIDEHDIEVARSSTFRVGRDLESDRLPSLHGSSRSRQQVWSVTFSGPACTRTIARLVSAARVSRCLSMAGGITSSEHLDTALAAGCTLFQGDLLGRPVCAGVVLDEEPRSLEDVFGARLGNCRVH